MEYTSCVRWCTAWSYSSLMRCSLTLDISNNEVTKLFAIRYTKKHNTTHFFDVLLSRNFEKHFGTLTQTHHTNYFFSKYPTRDKFNLLEMNPLPSTFAQASTSPAIPSTPNTQNECFFDYESSFGSEANFPTMSPVSSPKVSRMKTSWIWTYVSNTSQINRSPFKTTIT